MAGVLNRLHRTTATVPVLDAKFRFQNYSSHPRGRIQVTWHPPIPPASTYAPLPARWNKAAHHRIASSPPFIKQMPWPIVTADGTTHEFRISFMQSEFPPFTSLEIPKVFEIEEQNCEINDATVSIVALDVVSSKRVLVTPLSVDFIIFIRFSPRTDLRKDRVYCLAFDLFDPFLEPIINSKSVVRFQVSYRDWGFLRLFTVISLFCLFILMEWREIFRCVSAELAHFTVRL